MAKNGKGLLALALIFGLVGAGIGGYLIVKEFTSQESTTLPMAKVYYSGPTYTITSGGGFTVFDYTDAEYDTRNAFNFTDDKYYVPENGFYQVIAQYCIGAEDGDVCKIYIWLNSSVVSSHTSMASASTAAFAVSTTNIFNLTTDDTLHIALYIYNAGGFPRNIFQHQAYTYCCITKIAT